MIHAWYEKTRDQKDHIYFGLHEGVSDYSLNRYVLPGFHNSVEFAFCLQGSVEIVINGTSYTLRGGEICFINSLEPHRYYYYDKNVRCYIVLISSSFFNNVNRLGEISFLPHMQACVGFEAIKDYLNYAFKHWDPESLLFKRSFADMIAHLMTRFYPSMPRRAPEKQNAVLLEAVKYICVNCTERLTVGEVAAHFGYSTTYFSAAFNRFMGTSFTDYLNACRMIECQYLLNSDPELPAVRAAEMCGFGSMNTFYRARKKFINEHTTVDNPPRKELW